MGHIFALIREQGVEEVVVLPFTEEVARLSPLGLGLKLVAILAGSLFVAGVLRWAVGAPAIQRNKSLIDGINVLVLFVFVTAVMTTVASDFWANPIRMLELTVFAFAVSFVLVGVTTLIQPSFLSAVHVSSSSTPSATTRMPSLWASSIVA